MRIDRILLKETGPFDLAEISFPPGTNPDLADVYLLTGPNGSGKSTVLYAIAGLIGCGRLGRDLGPPRLCGPDAVAAIETNEFRRAMAWQVIGSDQRSSLPDPFKGGRPMVRQFENGRAGYFQDAPLASNEYGESARGFSVKMPVESQPKFSWAAFGYAGMRSVTDAPVTAIEELTDSPFDNSLSFIHTADTQRLARWIANQEFKRLKAKEAGRHERARQLEASVRDIERIVKEIAGGDFAFVTSEDDNNVRVRYHGAVIDLGLLPDGLKSIVSWVADLLMRLDRIPWVDDTPPMQRPFLLLLDEIDIHLHPEWQRRVLPIAQRMFPNAQIIASTHSPFVVASAEDAQIITLEVARGVARVEKIAPSQSGISYSTVLRSIFGIESSFNIETEQTFAEFHAAKRALLAGTTSDRAEVQRLANVLAHRSEEVGQLVAIELRQLDRQLALRGAS